MNEEKVYREHLLQRILEKTRPGENGCIEWTGIRNKAGYGLVSMKQGDKHRMVPAHRALYMIKTGLTLGRFEFVCHHCDNPGCVNFEHLFEGTPKDNVHDMLKKGRNAKQFRPHKRVRKYTHEQIREVKEWEGSNAEIAAKFGMTLGYVSAIRSGKAKAMVEGKPPSGVYYRGHILRGFWT